MYKVFNKFKRTYTSWLLLALDDAIKRKIDVLNFSFGGINFDDELVSDKV